MEIEFKSLVYALLFGIIPALLWLWFWLREDKKKPEPKGRLIATFIGGMLMVPLAIFFERLLFSGNINASLLPISIIVGWAVIEEVLKYGASWFTALRSKDDNEPIDPIIYLITTALGFAALENALFILHPIQDGLYLQSIITGNMRFIGATLLHIVASGTVGMTMAFSFYKNKLIKSRYLWTGLILAITLHALFNFFIIKSSGNIGIFIVFAVIWILAILMILIIEKVKKIENS